MSKPTHLGDGVYAEFDGWQVWVWTSNGETESDRIALEPGVLSELNKYYKRMVTEEPE
jgi:hypothetical protein